MEVFEKVDWGRVDNDRIVGSYIPMPDGSKHYIEMSMLHWYICDFYVTKAEGRLEDIAREVQDILDEPGASPTGEKGLSFDECFQHYLISFAKTWIKDTTGRG